MKSLSIKRDKNHYIVVIVCCCCLIVCSLGNTFNCAGLFYYPVSQELGAGIGQVAFYITIASLISGLAAPLAIKCFDKWGTTWVISCAALASIGCYLLMSAVKTLALLYLCGIILGLSTSFYGIPVVVYFISNWFDSKYDVVAGFVFSTAGIGGALLNPFYSAIMERAGWRDTYLCSAVVVFLLLFPCCILLQKDPSYFNLPKYNGGSKSERQSGQVTNKSEGLYVRKNIVLVICCIVGFLGFFVTGYVTHFKTYIISLGEPLSVGVIMTTFAMIANSVWKFLAGLFCEKIGGLCTGLLMLFLGIIGVSVLCASLAWYLLFYLSAFLLGAVYCVPSVCLSAIGKTFFEINVFASLYSIIQLFSSLGSASGFFLLGQIYDITGSYKAASVVCLCFLLVSFALLAALLISCKKKNVVISVSDLKKMIRG